MGWSLWCFGWFCVVTRAVAVASWFVTRAVAILYRWDKNMISLVLLTKQTDGSLDRLIDTNG